MTIHLVNSDLTVISTREPQWAVWSQLLLNLGEAFRKMKNEKIVMSGTEEKNKE